MSSAFFVYLVESPKPHDLYDGRSEGPLIASAVALNAIPCSRRLVTNKDMLQRALTEGARDEMSHHGDKILLLHLSAHGNASGIAMTDGTMVPWHELMELFSPLNKAWGGKLLLCMSSCMGFAARNMALYSGADANPYLLCVGAEKDATWSQTAVGYATFYHYLASGRPILDAVRAMKVASNCNHFTLAEPEGVRAEAQAELARLLAENEERRREESTAAQAALTEYLRSEYGLGSGDDDGENDDERMRPPGSIGGE